MLVRKLKISLEVDSAYKMYSLPVIQRSSKYLIPIFLVAHKMSYDHKYPCSCGLYLPIFIILEIKI